MDQDETRIRDLYERHVDYALAMVRKVLREAGMPPEYHRGERLAQLEQQAHLALLQAARDFDPELGTAFSSYAYWPLRRAIFEGLDQSNWMPRKYRRWLAEQRRRDELARRTLDTASADTPPAERLSRTIRMLAIGAALEKEGAPAGIEPEAREEPPADRAARREALDHLVGALERLPEGDRDLLRLLYWQEATTEEAGRAVGLDKSNVSRRRKQILDRLRRALEGLAE